MKIKKVCTNEIIVLEKYDKKHYQKTHLTLDGEYKKHKLIDIDKVKNNGRYFLNIEDMFNQLIAFQGYANVE